MWAADKNNFYEIQDWGELDYPLAQSRQLELVDKLKSTQKAGTLVFCSHPALLTLGRKTQKEDVGHWGGPIFESTRGGRVTYHGPSQLVFYPIVNLQSLFWQRLRPKDIHHYLSLLELTVLQTAQSLQIEAYGKTDPRLDWIDQDPLLDRSGVWAFSKKIASIGIAVRSWIAYHGAALQLFKDPHLTAGFRPCGFDKGTVSSFEELMGSKPHRDHVKELLIKNFLVNLGGS